ncbi:hypothetical protein AB4298_04745 [Shewanella sp. 10N.261.52.F9]|uniref:hypothetical protein n=1 Tax=Shewanella sp. 10N.261.52.F9 TaxID=3229684 RepID=UPI00354D6CA0
MIDIDGDKFSKHYPFNDDLTLQILKGHLLAEEILREIFKLSLNQPHALEGSNGTSFECHQVICLVEAICPLTPKLGWVWLAAKKLNSLRNKLAHSLEPKGIEHKVTDLINYVSSQKYSMVAEAKNSDPEASELFLVIMAICAVLSSIKDVHSAQA